MKVLITGGTGFIGSRLTLRCLQRGDVVRVLAQENASPETKNREVIESAGAAVTLGSVLDAEILTACVDGVDTVFHLAAAQHEANVADQHFRDVNVHGTTALLRASIDAGVRRFVHGSTIGVYGSLEGVIDEDSPLNPDNIYGVTKREGEQQVIAHGDRIPAVIVRISETYGPGDRRLLKLFRAIDKNVFFMIGDGGNLHHLIYIDDLIDGMFAAAGEDNAVGEIFVLSGKEAVTTENMARTIASALGRKPSRFRAPLWPFTAAATVMEKTLRPLGIQPPLHRRRMDFFKKSFTFAQDKSASILNFRSQVDFAQGVAATVKWYRDQGLL